MGKLPYEKLTIYEIEEFYESLLEEIKNKKDLIELDFIDIHKIDMVAIQLLLSLQQSCKQNSIELNIINFSSDLVHSLELCGCDKVLEVKND